MKKTVFLTVILIFFSPVKGELNYKICSIIIVNDKSEEIALNVEIADTSASRSRGLMFRESLDPDSGMLFVFNYEKTATFWMENTSIPLSIAFIDSEYIIFEIKEMTPFSRKHIVSTRPALYALEVNRGWFKKNNITPGSRLIINGCIRK